MMILKEPDSYLIKTVNSGIMTEGSSPRLDFSFSSKKGEKS